jgi:hypothetical protein
MASILPLFSRAKPDLAARDAAGDAAGKGRLVGVVMRRIAAFSAVAALCVTASGCVSDLGAQTTGQSSGQPRYYGGPKYPMWQTQ